MLLEVCANSYRSAVHAQMAGAQRIELCEQLHLGGVTPNDELIERVLSASTIPVFVLIRPRDGDFVYTESEFQIMKQCILLCKDLGCSGIVSGVLHSNHMIDLERTKELIDVSKPLPFTFHRAFDEVTDPKEALNSLIDLGATRILSSGKAVSAEEGVTLLNELKTIADGRITILPGGGINPQNAGLFKEHNFSEIHSSARQHYQGAKKHKFSRMEIISELLHIIS